ncbi:MAG: hypothetical protein UV61_C0002G0291 [Candidatus Gottesmanbacteria bacterium GW2011_GWB1_43_11]|uniref:Glycoside hydrolase family 5 domain-containing protein n=1 Tax=Candidatus Gottesmanbacteria bacterium GW2011_GWB1_43_11 TaxID=1618446 RepID=A0A0G1CP89_9BACT|nr:MAG: hypothetical protein UV04_C0001G0179 [Candidatus Gottesmanbacteria bacterium GW2011_GWA2_42_16]KKS56008.1 MAG: hypothetical protein UV17_C0004G0030 [Candidatus Gottesmanbacteria bacterium GW2011_GWA1_42_26]KKS80265.1 MAG: hypothetical protein UV55_C0044G0004 [Candidatus Gottesmanbacteria bacterium GW2011_GWC1_43_10]KKS87570.1 MAG: hypothetical protein UV61_C0002G0291 [Candidatus Gottesmanbacteria bacterium GW2011_GWB1_43_11]HCM37738.1 hypothetical protein [Patescibacteria group bacteriu
MKYIPGIIFILISLFLMNTEALAAASVSWWQFQSIDTMKYSRDPSREKLHDPDFVDVIRAQVKNIAATGATHVAIATPYDEEFLPILKQWVQAARDNKLKVWFRGNWSGWERWFGYDPIDRKQHLAQTEAFILKHPEVFADGDVFTACPECENGGPGDPRRTGDVTGHRQFLIQEYRMTKAAFVKIDRQVQSNFFSMNGDIARLVMDRETTTALDGLVVIDHYVASQDKLVQDIKDIAQKSGGQVVLGEFGAPIPDIHGRMSEAEQATWIKSALTKLVEVKELAGINYWVNVGGSTQIWNESGVARAAVAEMTAFYTPKTISGYVVGKINNPIAYAKIETNIRETLTNKDGYFALPYLDPNMTLKVSAIGYAKKELNNPPIGQNLKIIIDRNSRNWFIDFMDFIRAIFKI